MNEPNPATGTPAAQASPDRRSGGATGVGAGQLEGLKAPAAAEQKPIPLLLTVNEAASLLGCHKVTVYRLIYQGRLRICRAFRSLRIPRKEIDRLVADVKPYDTSPRRVGDVPVGCTSLSDKNGVVP